MNVLSQIGLGYPFLFLMWRRALPIQLSAVVLLIAATGILYITYKTEGIDLQNGNADLGVPAEFAQANLTNMPPQWHKNANVGTEIDRVVLNLFPREKPYVYERGGYQTINFIPSLITMILGLICGELLRSSLRGQSKTLMLLAMGGVLIALGWFGAELLHWPIVKRIWTPTWALFSTGICCLILATLYGIIDVLGWRAWSFVLVVVGMNSIAIYMMGQMLRGWTKDQLYRHFGQTPFTFLGENYVPMLECIWVGLAFWLACLWMYRQRIFVRV